MDEHEALMARCIELARQSANTGNYALASLVALDGRIVAEQGSTLARGVDPSAHPEMVAIRNAAAALNNRYLPGAVLYTTLEPCPMCTSVAIWAKFGGVVFGATQDDALAWSSKHPDPLFTWRQILVPCEHIVAHGHPQPWVRRGVLRDQCIELFSLSRRPTK